MANENSQATIAMPTELTLSKAYPNPIEESNSLKYIEDKPVIIQIDKV